ncbi:transglutaminase domain-containing protein [Alteribacter aurantiacus]|uniref:transglutaminase domain-containing protein n=1 Tax=Alteribacter aurantiacus TaxID=254410 RepID=UPI000425A3A8|nr:transglutaminase-like domain-containing protein [Alteribacter aurantiacus]
MAFVKRNVWVLMASLLVLGACGDEEETISKEEANEAAETEEAVEETNENDALDGDVLDEEIDRLSAEVGVETEVHSLTGYAEEIGLTLTSPVYQRYATHNQVTIEGQIEHTADFQSDQLWVNVRYSGDEDLPYDNTMDHYVAIEEDGSFTKDFFLHGGMGEHRIVVRAPSTTDGEDNRFYDVSNLVVTKVEEELIRDIEVTSTGASHQLMITQPETGIITADGTFVLSGELPLAEDDHSMIVEVKGEGSGESEDVKVEIEDGSFQSDIPLYFGEAYHEVILKVFNPEDELYYEAATLYVDNRSNDRFVGKELFIDYFERGVTLSQPTVTTPLEHTENTYRFAGELDSSIPGADEIEQMIITTEYEGEEEATYYIPVTDYSFDGDVWLRFGEGEYVITISVPELTDDEESFFRYRGVAQFTHEVTGVEDERSLLPSRGIESDHEDIQSLADELTSGLTVDREKAKAVYDYLAENIAYDVEKFNDRLFEMDDSAVKTLELQKGVCQDYAFLGVALLRAIDMEANYVAGMAGSGFLTRERHAWIEVKVDGEWIEMDPTWGAGYIDEETDEFVFNYTDDYFDPDEDFLNQTHTREEIMY